MKIPRMSMITLGVADLDRATAFYEQVLSTPPNKSHDGVRFIAEVSREVYSEWGRAT